MLEQRATEARAASKFAKILKRDLQGRPVAVLVPGHEGKTYMVIIKRDKGSLVTECLLETGNGEIPCKGAGQSVCYHQMAAIDAIANDTGAKVWFCETPYDAKHIRTLFPGSTFHYLASKQAQPMVGIWVVVKK